VNSRSDVNKLLFPVKLCHLCCSVPASRRIAEFRLVTLALSIWQCGYAPAYGGERPTQQLTVNAAPSLVPESGALAAVLSGLRQELSRAGALRPGSGYPQAVVELLRVDERSAGIAVQAGQPSAVPLARGALVGVTARARVFEGPGAEPFRDTGDVRRVATASSETSLVDDAWGHDDAVQLAAVSVGKALGRRLLGEVEPSMEPL